MQLCSFAGLNVPDVPVDTSVKEHELGLLSCCLQGSMAAVFMPVHDRVTASMHMVLLDVC